MVYWKFRPGVQHAQVRLTLRTADQLQEPNSTWLRL
jgi:hypothetical protein